MKNIELIQLDLLSEASLNKLIYHNFDIVFSWATIIYVHPRKFKKLIKILNQLSLKQLIFIERNFTKKSFFSYLDFFRNAPNWIHNYVFELKLFEKDLIVRQEKVPNEIWLPGGGSAFLLDIRKSH